MIEFSEEPTQAEVHEVFQETIVLLTMMTHPTLHEAAALNRQVERTYALSPPYSMVVLASIGAGRVWRLAQEGGQQLLGGTPFPRAVLQTVPSDGRPDVLFLAIDLVETIACGGRARSRVDQLMVDGTRGYQVLLSVVHELGWLAARADHTLGTVVELVALEALTAEQDWIASQQSC